MRRAAAVLALALSAAAPGLRAAEPAAAEVLFGIDVLQERGFRDLSGKRVGLITNHTGLDRKGRSTLQILANAPGVQVKALFTPEHGFAGTSESETVDSGTIFLPRGEKIPLFSLYGATRAPTGEMLKGIDALVFDIQGIGARFYTYSATMALAMESAAKADIEFFVLDRPVPIGGTRVEGPVRAADPELKSFISFLPVPIRHGMTMGELARFHNFDARLGVRLRVIPLQGWRRKMWYDETGLPWTAPSPNMPDLDAATLYPGIACFEATNISVGRGTPVPFRWIGAPWLDAAALLGRMKAANLPGISFSMQVFTPSKSVFEGESTPGIRMTVTDRETMLPLRVFAHLAAALRDLHPDAFVVDSQRLARFVGNKEFVNVFKNKAEAGQLIELLEIEAALFKARQAPFLLY